MAAHITSKTARTSFAFEWFRSELLVFIILCLSKANALTKESIIPRINAISNKMENSPLVKYPLTASKENIKLSKSSIVDANVKNEITLNVVDVCCLKSIYNSEG
jgi:hypothetical protein